MMETKISDFNTSFYITDIQKLDFHLPHVCILGTNHCGEIRRTSFKIRELFQDVLCCRDYADMEVTSFANQIQSEYYGVNIYVHIDGIELEHFSKLPKADINSTALSHQLHAVFHSFLSEDSKQDAASNTAHIKSFISLLKEKQTMTTLLIKIWENNDGCAEKYRCDSALFLISVRLQCYSIIIDRGISVPGNVKEVVYGLNAVDKRYINQLMPTVKLPGSNIFDSQIQMHTGTKK